ncbi:MAG: SDR family oxidoreductase [Actinomycetia bacterium]|nr:SDR family oxidoreductase [Actinomycetes bacterium]
MTGAASAPPPLAGRVAVVTGGTYGIGAAAAATLSELGAAVVAAGRRPEAVKEPIAGVTYLAADVRSYDDMQRLRDTALSQYGGLDIVVANAGISDWGVLAEGDPTHWPQVVETNILGTAYTLKATLPHLIAQGHGHVVIVSSISGRVAYAGEPIYIATKWALVGLGRSVRKEVAPHGVKVTLIEPGIVDTPMVSNTEEGRLELAQVEALTAANVADTIGYALTRPGHVDIDELMLSPVEQTL